MEKRRDLIYSVHLPNGSDTVSKGRNSNVSPIPPIPQSSIDWDIQLSYLNVHFLIFFLPPPWAPGD